MCEVAAFWLNRNMCEAHNNSNFTHEIKRKCLIRRWTKMRNLSTSLVLSMLPLCLVFNLQDTGESKRFSEKKNNMYLLIVHSQMQRFFAMVDP